MPFVSLHHVMVRCGSSICVGRYSIYVNSHVKRSIALIPHGNAVGGWEIVWLALHAGRGGMAVQSARRVFNECGSSR
jgi:hypothetical protein